MASFVPGYTVRYLQKRLTGAFIHDVVEVAETVGNAFVYVGNQIAHGFVSAYHGVADAASYAWAVAAEETKLYAQEVAKAVTVAAEEIAYNAKKQIYQIIEIVESGAKLYYNVVKQIPSIIYGLVQNSFKPELNAKVSYKWSSDNDDQSANLPPSWGRNNKLLFKYTEGSRQPSKGGYEDYKSTFLINAGNTLARKLPPGSMKVDCVDCGIAGSFAVSGRLNFQIIPPSILDCHVDLDGDFRAGVNLGIQAHLLAKGEKRKTIVSYPLPGGFTIIELVNFGPSLTVESSMKFEVDMQADMLLGMDLNVPNFQVHLDMIVPDQSSTSFPKPLVTFRNEFNGAGGIKATVGLPFSVGIGLQIPKLKFDKSASLIIEPSLTAIGTTGAAPQTFAAYGLPDCPLGIAYTVGTGATLSTNIFDAYQYTLASINGPTLAKGCNQKISPSDLAQFNDQYSSIIRSLPQLPSPGQSPANGNNSGNNVSVPVTPPPLPRISSGQFTFYSLSASNVTAPLSKHFYFSNSNKLACMNQNSVSLRNSTRLLNYLWSLNSAAGDYSNGYLSNSNGSLQAFYDVGTGQVYPAALSTTFDAAGQPIKFDTTISYAFTLGFDLLYCTLNNVNYSLDAVTMTCRGDRNSEVNTFYRCGVYDLLYVTKGSPPTNDCSLVDDLTYDYYSPP
jgi:hypothetical protein